MGDDTMAASGATARIADNVVAARRAVVEPKPIHR
jgi:hypothetical protein